MESRCECDALIKSTEWSIQLVPCKGFDSPYQLCNELSSYIVDKDINFYTCNNNNSDENEVIVIIEFKEDVCFCQIEKMLKTAPFFDCLIFNIHV